MKLIVPFEKERYLHYRTNDTSFVKLMFHIIVSPGKDHLLHVFHSLYLIIVINILM